MRYRWWYTLALALVLVPFARAQDDEQALRDVAVRWQELYNARDYDAVMELYTDAPTFFGIDGGVHEGREAVAASLEAPLPVPPGEGTIAITTDEAEAFGDVGYATGGYVIEAADGAELVRGSWMTLSRRVDGEWRVHRHAANMVLPQPEETPAAASTNDAAYDPFSPYVAATPVVPPAVAPAGDAHSPY